jgi:S-adenosylmethionine:tRNA ribosyltransferase-isomerase
MLTRDFIFSLPEELIAQQPTARRRDSRLLALSGGRPLLDLRFFDVETLLRPGDLLVLNDTRVIPARLFGRKTTGGRVEIMVERILDERTVLVQLRASKPPHSNSVIELDQGVELKVAGRKGEFFVLETGGGFLSLLEQQGHVPLPPYVRRSDDIEDRERYQTVYAARSGAVAAPTAGLHFDRAMLDRLDTLGVEKAFVTLHVGAGTFQPVRAEKVSDHHLHAEWLEVSGAVVEAVAVTRARGGRVVAVGTTTVRSLETAAASGVLRPFCGDSRLFIHPGYSFKVVDALLTNFHLPGSSLVMLVCAFGGYRRVMDAYAHAVARRYRFFSYGDAMFVDRGGQQDLPLSAAEA